MWLFCFAENIYNILTKVYTDTHVRLETIGWVKLSEYNRTPINSKHNNPRVSFDGVHWYISVGIEIELTGIELTNESLGIDLGIKNTAICSNKEEPTIQIKLKS